MKDSLWISFLLALLVSGCSQEDVLKNEPSVPEGRIFTTSFESDESRTYVGDDNLSYWTADDRISLFDGNTLNRQYRFDGKTGDDSGTFSIVEKPYGTGRLLTENYAVYPYDKDVRISTEGVVTTTLPAQQNYAFNSYGLGDNTMVAVTEDTDDTFLYFKNVGGCFKLELYGDDVTVKSITLRGNNGEKIAGKSSITVAYGEEPGVIMADDATQSITLECGDGVKIGSTAETATAFWIVVPPTVFEKGITVTVKDINDRMFVQTTANELEIERNVIKPMTAVEVNPEIPYLTFVANDAQTLTMSKAVDRLEYSVNGGGWNELGTNIVEFGGEQGILRLRGKNLNGTAISTEDFSTIDFGNGSLVACSGDIRTLLDYENFKTVDTRNAQFCWLFASCASLISAPELPATELAEVCYRGMFYCCSNLIQAPALPATKLSSACYVEMFSGCRNLIQAPELPATTLADLCYWHMFNLCTSLTVAPELPATTLVVDCYDEMFLNCTSLIQAPELPATELALGCYRSMFAGCTSLVQAPDLPATELANGCYDSMFKGCISLIESPILPAGKLAEECYYSMFAGCINLTEAPALPATELATNCYMEMFKDCTSLTQAPVLPATELLQGSYALMFAGCTSLKTAPALPATKLYDSCYLGMFSGSGLTEAPALSATTLEASCYRRMFEYCSNLKQAPALPATKLAGNCYMEMFKGSTNLVEAPVLSATTLARLCYHSMFKDCSSLQDITMLATDISAECCLDEWVNGVSTTGTFTKAAEMTSLLVGMNGIPDGWTVNDYTE